MEAPCTASEIGLRPWGWAQVLKSHDPTLWGQSLVYGTGGAHPARVDPVVFVGKMLFLDDLYAGNLFVRFQSAPCHEGDGRLEEFPPAVPGRVVGDHEAPEFVLRVPDAFPFPEMDQDGRLHDFFPGMQTEGGLPHAAADPACFSRPQQRRGDLLFHGKFPAPGPSQRQIDPVHGVIVHREKGEKVRGAPAGGVFQFQFVASRAGEKVPPLGEKIRAGGLGPQMITDPDHAVAELEAFAERLFSEDHKVLRFVIQHGDLRKDPGILFGNVFQIRGVFDHGEIRINRHFQRRPDDPRDHFIDPFAFPLFPFFRFAGNFT